MPNVLIPLPSVAQSVTRPVYTDMIQQVQKLTNIDEKTKIFFPGDIQKMHTAGSTIEGNGDRLAIFNSERYTFIEIEDDYDQDALGSTAVEYEEHAPIFSDTKLGVTIKPVYATTTVSINFTYRCPSKSEAQRWRDEARVRVSKLMDLNLHKVSYHFQLPIDVVIILKEIYDKREANLPYGQTFVEYVTSLASPRLTLTGNLIGEHEALAISETQTRIQGMFTWDGLPEKAQRDDTKGTWSISFSYKFNFEKPIQLHMRYPVMVHNQLLSPVFIEFTDKAPDVEYDPKVFTKSSHALHAFEMQTLMATRADRDSVIRIPSYDDYNIPDVNLGTGTVLIALCEVGADRRSLLNLNELGDFVIDSDILDFIRLSEYPYITKDYRSILRLNLYRNDFITSDRLLVCNSALDVATNANLDLRNQYRIRLSIVVDITLLDTRALQRLQNYPRAMVKIIGSMNELLKNHPDFNNLGSKTHISNNDFSHVTSFLTGYRIPGATGNYFGPGIDNRDLFKDMDPQTVENYRRNSVGKNRVMNTSIIAHRRVENN